MLDEVIAEPILLLKTHDKRGRTRVDPVFYRRFGDEYIIVAAREPGETSKPDWYLNLKREPIVEIQVEGEDYFAVASTPVHRDRMDIWPLVSALAVDVEKQLPRNITGVLLSPLSLQNATD